MSDSQLDPERAANLAENPYAGQGPVMLDIGDDVGAVVLHLPASLEGAEVEVESAEESDDSDAPDASHDHPHPADHPHPHGHGHGHGHEHEHEHGPHRPHVAVVGRPVGDHVDYSAVFPALVAGRYLLHVPGAPDPVVVDVRGGEVSDTTWPGDPAPSGE